MFPTVVFAANHCCFHLPPAGRLGNLFIMSCTTVQNIGACNAVGNPPRIFINEPSHCVNGAFCCPETGQNAFSMSSDGNAIPLEEESCYQKLLAELDSVTATSVQGSIIIKWITSFERDNLGFNLWRAERDNNGEYINIVKLNDKIIPSLGADVQQSYFDNTVTLGITYYYLLEDINSTGDSFFHWKYVVSALAN